jgi:signal transduction histidine kinase
MLWEETEEPWRYRAKLTRGAFECVREPVKSAEPVVVPALEAHDFLCLHLRGPRPTTLYAIADGIERWQAAPLAAGFRERLASTSLLAVRLTADGFEGRLFVLDRPGASTDDLALGGIVARQISADLEQFYMQEQLRQAELSEERARFARELHDGVLQSLTGLALQLRAVRRLLDSDPAAARDQLEELENQVAAEQADMRFFVQQMKPLAVAGNEVNAALTAHLRALGERMQRQWGLRIELTVEPLARQLSEALAHASFRIVQEALANAARHGAATGAQVRLATTGEQLHLTVADNGRGFAFRGRYDLAALDAMGQGPASLEGELAIESTPSGARLEIALPLGPRLRLISALEPGRAAGGNVARTG